MEKEFDLNRRQHLILSDEYNQGMAEKRQQDLKKDGHLCVLITNLDQLNESEVLELLSNQPLGTMLWIHSCGDDGRNLQQYALSSGFSRNDIRMCVEMHEKTPVFCSQCHNINRHIRTYQFDCQACGKRLETSNHYSAYHHAYLGYPVFNTLS